MSYLYSDHSSSGDQKVSAARDARLEGWLSPFPLVLRGRRRIRLFTNRDLLLETRGRIRNVDVVFESWGDLNAAKDNAVLVHHALTGDSHAASNPDSPASQHTGWWEELIGPGKAIDTNHYFVICPNVLGGCQGTTGPSSFAADGKPYGSRFPTITIRDQVALEVALADALGIAVWYAVIGGSMGGMRSLEWAIALPERVNRAVLIATTAASTAEQIALSSAQIEIIRADPHFVGGNYYDFPQAQRPHVGLALARWLGQISYRTETELDIRFGRLAGSNPLSGGRFDVESYLLHHGRKLVNRFDANTYVALSRAMNLHDVGRGRGGVLSALQKISAHITVVSIDSDRLYPPRLQEELSRMIPTHPPVRTITSLHGHDGFLIEIDQLSSICREALEAELDRSVHHLR